MFIEMLSFSWSCFGL